MKIPTKLIINKLNSINDKASRYDSLNNEERIFWTMLQNIKGVAEVDVNELISLYYDTQSREIVNIVLSYANINELKTFAKHTKGLVDEKSFKELLDKIETLQAHQEIKGITCNHNK